MKYTCIYILCELYKIDSFYQRICDLIAHFDTKINWFPQCYVIFWTSLPEKLYRNLIMISI